MIDTTTTGREPLSLDLIRWFQAHGWARRRAVTNAQRRGVPILLVFHPAHGYGAVSARLYERYDTTGCTVVERIEDR